MTPKAQAARTATLGLIDAAQTLLYQAAQTSCDLQGFADEWRAIGDHADATKALWHRVNAAPLPTGHDHDDAPAVPVRRCLDSIPKLHD